MSTKVNIMQRREEVLSLLTKGFKRCEIAKQLNVDEATITRDTQYLVGASQSYLNSLAKETLPFMYYTSIEGIKTVLKEAYVVYNSPTSDNSQKLAALKLIKECHESMFVLTSEGPFLLQVRSLENRLCEIEKQKNDNTKLSR